MANTGTKTSVGASLGTGHHLILGAPGTGKTQTLLDAATDYLASGQDPASLLVLTPSRISATRFREELTERAQRTLSVAPIRAWQAYAFDLLRRAHIAGLLPGLDFAPKLLSGPEQDVMIAELLEGHASGFGTRINWPLDLGEAIGTRGFRHEIRDFFDRMAEYNLTPAQVEELGKETGHPEWVAAAQFYREYRSIRRLRMPNAYDPSALIHEAADVLSKNPDFLAAERESLALILIDDLQEATPAIYRLLGVLCGNSSDTPAPSVALALCTDTVVQGFRGARPDLAAGLGKIFPQLEKIELSESHRMPADIMQAWEAVAGRIPVVAGALHPRDLSQPSSQESVEEGLWPGADDGALLDPIKSQDDLPQVLGLTLDSAQQEARLLAQMILEDHLYRGRAYSRTAIIVRNGTTVANLQRTLEAQGVRVKTAQTLKPVRDEPAVRPFLDALALLVHGQRVASQQSQEQEAETTWGLGVDVALNLLTSRLGGASAMDIRRLRQLLRAEELRSGGVRASDDLLVETLLDPDKLPQGRAALAARRIAEVLEAGGKELRVPGATAETVLWALWEKSSLADEWKKNSQLGGPVAERANQDLDAMIGLFEAAKRYVDQMPGATAAQFLDYIDAQDLPMDTLAPRARTRDAVEILTPALAAGRQWDTVYVAGLQDGVWPNTTIRGSLLNTQALTDIFDLGKDAAAGVGVADRLRDTRYDELRQFSTAISRASKRLVCTAVSSADDAPSELLDIVAPAQGGERENTRVRRPMTLRAMVAELRQWAEKQDTDPARAEAAAKILHRFNNPDLTSGSEIAGVNPASWWGLLPLSSDAPTFVGGGPVPLSPSRIETIHKSPLDWFVAAARAEAATDIARSIGTLVHELAEDMPDWLDGAADEPKATFRSQVMAELDQRFSRLNLPDTWETALIYQRAQDMISKFVDYVADLHSQDGRDLIGVEGSFRVRVPGPQQDAILSGRIDRLERNKTDGRYVIVDLKTGKSQPTKQELTKHPQLASYQVALEAGAGDYMAERMANQTEDKPDKTVLEFEGLEEKSGGAYLVQIGRDTKSYGAQEQEALSADAQWAVELINRAAALIASKHLEARHDSSSNSSFGRGCRLPDICPLCSRGRQVTQS